MCLRVRVRDNPFVYKLLCFALRIVGANVDCDQNAWLLLLLVTMLLLRGHRRATRAEGFNIQRSMDTLFLVIRQTRRRRDQLQVIHYSLRSLSHDDVR